jgi:hypothetical protein
MNLKAQLTQKSTDYVTKEQAAANADIIEKIYDFPGENPLQNSFDTKADYVEKDSIAKIENLRANVIFRIHDKQLVNLVK